MSRHIRSRMPASVAPACWLSFLPTSQPTCSCPSTLKLFTYSICMLMCRATSYTFFFPLSLSLCCTESANVEIKRVPFFLQSYKHLSYSFQVLGCVLFFPPHERSWKKWSVIKCFDSEIKQDDLKNPFLELKITPIHSFCLFLNEGQTWPHCNFNQFSIQKKASSFVYSFYIWAVKSLPLPHFYFLWLRFDGRLAPVPPHPPVPRSPASSLHAAF